MFILKAVNGRLVISNVSILQWGYPQHDNHHVHCLRTAPRTQPYAVHPAYVNGLDIPHNCFAMHHIP